MVEIVEEVVVDEVVVDRVVVVVVVVEAVVVEVVEAESVSKLWLTLHSKLAIYSYLPDVQSMN